LLFERFPGCIALEVEGSKEEGGMERPEEELFVVVGGE